ncbi:amino acid permease-domain-containing protein [Umbelopsis sp. PMI_123]|nr:amino acid permease-domain-containing protein [Umbelopsis sp. PMI_123]
MDHHEMLEWDHYGATSSNSSEKRDTNSRHEFMISDDVNPSYTYGSYVHTISARYNRVEPESYLQQNGESKTRYFGRKIMAIKPYELLYSEYEGSELKKTLNRIDLVFVGIGAIIGTGIFVLSGHAAAVYAGPAVAISFIIAGIAAAFAALSYSEMASMIPVSGSAYTYTYATMGEIFAWVIGWDLILEYMIGAATVAVGWSGYFVYFFQVAFNVNLGTRWTTPTLVWTEVPASLGYNSAQGSYFNAPGCVIIILLTALLVIGIRESSWVNNVIVTIKLFIVVLFICSLCGFVDTSNYDPYVPPHNSEDWHLFGVGGIFAAAQQVFFAYVGFDAVSTASMESRDAARDLPVGIITSLVVCTLLYIATATVMTGAANYTLLNTSTPVSTAITAAQVRTGHNFRWLNIIVSLGALAGLTSVMLIFLMGQPRIFHSMARDGLLPRWLGKVHPRFKTPYRPTIIAGVISAILCSILPVDILGNLTSVGTLLAFFLVHFGIIILRFTRPDIPRSFTIPGGRWGGILIPLIGMAISILLIAVAEVTTIWRLFVWAAIGLIVYFSYSVRHSRINNDPINFFREAKEEQEAARLEKEAATTYEYA